jgi:hypothetical protein
MRQLRDSVQDPVIPQVPRFHDSELRQDRRNLVKLTPSRRVPMA